MENENLLPRPQTDLPAPELEIPAHASEMYTEQTNSDHKTDVHASTPEHYNKPPIRKLLIAGIIAALILAGIVGAYFLGKNNSNQQVAETEISSPSPTPNPTADWNSYTDKLTGISFKYPTDWFMEKYDSEDLSIFINKEKFELCNGCEISTNIQMYYNGISDPVTGKTSFTNNTLAKADQQVESNLVKSTIKTTPMTIEGKNAIQINGDWVPGYYPAGTNVTLTLIEINGKVLEVTLNDQSYNDIYQEVVNSLKFNNPTISATPTPLPMANWKKYTDVNYPFSIQYPQEWTVRTTYGKSVNNTKNNRVAGIDITNNLSYGSTLVMNVINSDGLSFNEWMKQQSGYGNQIPSQPNYSYKGIPAYKITFEGSNSRDGVAIFYPYKDKIIYLEWTSYTNDQENIDKIVESLTFN